MSVSPGSVKNKPYFQYYTLKCLHLFPVAVSVLPAVVDAGCSYCGGLGHRITECPKLEAMQSKQASTIGRKDYLASGAADW